MVRVWLEETAQEAGAALWRGHISHVPSGEWRYVQCLDDIRDFIAVYLERMGVHSECDSGSNGASSRRCPSEEPG